MNYDKLTDVNKGSEDTGCESHATGITNTSTTDDYQLIGQVQGEAAQVNGLQETDVNNESLGTEADAIKRKRDNEISACFEKAKRKLGGLLKNKKEVIRDLACELERLGRRTEDIAAEIVAELSGCEEISKSLIYSYLDDRYKDQTQAQRRKGKKKPVPETGTEPATKQEQEAIVPTPVIETSVSGQEVVGFTSESQAKTEEVGWGSGIDSDTSPSEPEQGAETGISINHDTYASKPSPAAAAQEEETTSLQPGPGIGIEHVCESCSTKDAKIMELEQALTNLKTINSGTGNHIEASFAHNRSYNSFDKSELSGEEEERGSPRKCKNCEILQQKYEQLQSKLQGYKEAVRVQTSIKTAKELFYRSADGYQQFEFSVPLEPLRQHIIAAFNSNSRVNRVWFTGKFNHKTGEVVDIQIGKITHTNTTEAKKESKTSVVLKDDTLNDTTGD
jgi:hypothetical protein